MKFTSTAFALFAATLSAIPALAENVNTILNYDLQYDNPNGLLSSTACSADAGTLHGIKTFGKIPTFPHIAGSFVVEGFNSTDCGSCYELTYVRDGGLTVSFPFTVINSASGGFISSFNGVHDLTGLPIERFPGNAPITFRPLPASVCGFT